MKRVWPIAAIAAAIVAAAPVASSTDAPEAPTAALRVTPSNAVAGDSVTLDASASRDDGTVVSYAWDLDGDGSFERVAGPQSSLTESLSAPGTIRLGVRVVDDAGLSSDAFETVTVQPKPKEIAAPEPEAEPEPEPEPEPVAPATRKESKELSAPQPAPRREPREDAPTVSAAASASVSIRDFSFAPRSVTVNTGDSVTWRNTGDEVHTATGDGFDTGNLSPGQSGSHTFRTAGTFSYLCTPHPFMRGTVRVVGAGGGGGGGGGGADGVGSAGTGSGDPDTGDAGSSGSTGDLPSTGLALSSLVLTGLVMLMTGVSLRRRVGHDSR